MKPVNLDDALGAFDDYYSPRIVNQVNEYDVKIAHTLGDHVWHTHEKTDEFFLVLEGHFEVALRDAEGNERAVALRKGDTFVVPQGVEHKPTSRGGAILMFEPRGTVSTGDTATDLLPDNLEATTGHIITE